MRRVQNATTKVLKSRQSARECRARKKVRHQKLEERIIIQETKNTEIYKKLQIVL